MPKPHSSASASTRALVRISHECRRKLYEAIPKSVHRSGEPPPVSSAHPGGASDATDSEQGHAYSRTGTDLVGVLARVAARHMPQIQLGPVDLSCAITLARVDADPGGEEPQVSFEDVSPEFLKLLGRPREAVIGRHPSAVLHTRDALETPTASDGPTAPMDPFTQQLYRQAVAGQEQQAILTLVRSDGSHCNAFITLIPLRQEVPQEEVPTCSPVEWIVGFQAEVSPQYALKILNAGSEDTKGAEAGPLLQAVEDVAVHAKKGSDAATASSQPPMQHQPSAGGARITTDDDDPYTVHIVLCKGALRYVSPNVEGLLGYRPEALIGAPVEELCHPNDIVALLRELKDLKSARSKPPVSNQSQDDELYTAVAPSKPSRAPVKAVRLSDKVTKQPVLAEVDGLLRMKHRNSELVWMRSSSKLVLQAGGSGRKSQSVVAVSGRPRESFLRTLKDGARSSGSSTSTVSPASGSVSQSPPTSNGPFAPTMDSRGKRTPPPVWLAISDRGIILQCVVQGAHGYQNAKSYNESELPVRVGYALPSLMNQEAMMAAQQLLQRPEQEQPLCLAHWIGNTPILSTWVPLTSARLTPELSRLGARMLVRLESQQHGFDHVPNVLFEPEQRLPALPADASFTTPSIADGYGLQKQAQQHQAQQQQAAQQQAVQQQAAQQQEQQPYWWFNLPGWNDDGNLQSTRNGEPDNGMSRPDSSLMWPSTSGTTQPASQAMLDVPQFTASPMVSGATSASSLPASVGATSVADLAAAVTSTSSQGSDLGAAPAYRDPARSATGISTSAPISGALSSPMPYYGMDTGGKAPPVADGPNTPHSTVSATEAATRPGASPSSAPAESHLFWPYTLLDPDV